MARAYLTRRTLLQLDEIDLYSKEHWGERVATQYLADMHAAIERLEERPTLLKERPEYSVRLCFHHVREHVLVCDVIGDDIHVLAIIHGSMDLPRRIAELEPQLVHETRFLRQRIVRERRDDE